MMSTKGIKSSNKYLNFLYYTYNDFIRQEIYITNYKQHLFSNIILMQNTYFSLQKCYKTINFITQYLILQSYFVHFV